MRTNTLAIGLFRDSIEIALFRRRRILAARRLPIDLEGAFDVAAWIREIGNLGPSLRSMLDELGCAGGARAVVTYESPSAVANCFSLPATSIKEARHAAMLAASDSIPQATVPILSATLFVGRDDSTVPIVDALTEQQIEATARSAMPHGRSHVIAAAEREDVVLAMRRLLQQAGVELIGALPIQALIAASALQRSSHGNVAESTTVATLHLGESGSLLVIRDRATDRRRKPGALRFTRSISIGSTALAAALMRATGSTSGQDETETENAEPTSQNSELDRDSARRALFEFGLPNDAAAVHEATGLTARDVLPLIQPLVQRLIVELRQSLRYAIDQNERTNTTLFLSGAGGAIPGLAAALQRELGVAVSVDEQCSDYDPAQVGCPAGELNDLIDAYARRSSTLVDELFLQPPGLALKQTAQRLSRALWAGAAAALVLIALDSARLTGRLVDAEMTESASITPASAAHRNIHLGPLAKSDPTEILTLLDYAAEFKAAVDRETSNQVNLRFCLQELSGITPRSIRFTSLTFQTPQTQAQHSAPPMEATITGVAREGSASGARNDLDRFIQQLRASALIDTVELVNVQFAPGAADSIDRHFEIRLAALSTPKTAQPPQKDQAPVFDNRTVSAPNEGIEP